MAWQNWNRHLADDDNDEGHPKDYPLNCLDDTGDGFSGWFAISNPRKCNDFCYWNHPAGNNSTNISSYAAWNTDDPHHSTVIETPVGTAYWTCIYDSSDDKSLISKVTEQRWIDSWQTYSSHNNGLKPPQDGNNVPFPYLRCQKGAGEHLKTWSGEVVKSAAFWETWIVLSSLVYVVEIAAIVIVCRRRGKLKLRYERVGSPEESSQGAMDGGATDDDRSQKSSLQIDATNNDDDSGRSIFNITRGLDNEGGSSIFRRFSYKRQNSPLDSSNYVVTPRCKYCSPLTAALCRDPKRLQQTLHVLKILLVVALNLLLAFTITFSSISLMEIHRNPHFKESMQKLTPACADPTLVCPAGNKDIDREFSSWPPGERLETNNEQTMQPFSYLIASDSQLYWFNGEFPEMGKEPLPPACSPSDSCGRCTGKHGLNTNKRLKNAWESLMTGKTDGMNNTSVAGDLPVPNTLIMNGDLTAYFHPYQKRAYELIYDNIDGLKYYFPSLGNHDIEHLGGGMYGNDEWAGGVPNCNMEHAIGYFKSGFCGEIPAFDTDRIVRYDSSSLAYSWDEGRYHFVHTHYYPSYEMASMRFRSSLDWLERDLQIAHDAGLTTILFVHAVQGLNDAMEKIILGKNVKAIIAGHTHRCLHRRCEGIYPLHEEQVENLDSLGIVAEKCIPAAYDTCQVLNGENLILVKDMEGEVTFPKKKLHNDDRDDKLKPLCPKPGPFYINETDNSLLCRRVTYSHPNFPFNGEDNSTESIPIFWSGSSSFETFLRGDFFDDRFVINSMTVTTVEGEVARYVDLHSIPNAIHPYHETSDVEETVIYL